MKHLSRSPEDTERLAQDLLNALTPSSKGVVVALEGDLGAGKTSFSQAVGKALGVAENMHSPTFVIMKAYKVDFKGFKKLVHIDAYRIEKESELLHLGWEEMVREPENLILVEWPGNVPGLIPSDAMRLGLRVVDETTREIETDAF